MRFAFRQLLKNPGFTAVAVLTLALGIGANTAVFSVVNAVLLRPLPYPDSERLVGLAERGLDWNDGAIAWPNFVDWRTQQSVFERLGLYTWNDFVLTGRDKPVQLRGAHVTTDVFAALRVQPAIGRLFNEDEDKPGAPSVVVLSDRLWRDHLDGDPAIVGRTITLDGNRHTVVGVMPSGFAFPEELSLWVPAGPLSAKAEWQDRGNHPGLYAIGRLEHGMTLKQARAEMDSIAVRLEQQYPESNKNRRVQVERRQDIEVGGARRALWVLLGAVGLVLLIACANVANLLLARAAARQKEMAVRAALGASRWQIIRQLLAESLLLALIGGAAGLVIAQAGLRLILIMGRNTLPRATGIELDSKVLLFSAAIALLTGILFGLAPAWQASRPELQHALTDSGRGTTSGRARLRHGLVVAEVALTLILLMGAGLLLRSFDQLRQVRAGFVHERVLSFRVSLPERKYPTAERTGAFYQSLLERLRRLHGVQAASVSSRLPLEGGAWDTSFLIEGEPVPPPHERPSMDVQTADPDYFRVMSIPIVRGRAFNKQDNREHLRDSVRKEAWGAGLNAMIIDEAFARRYWPSADPIGQRVRMDWGKDAPVLTVVGVVPTVKWHRLAESPGHVQAYLPFLQLPSSRITVEVKTTSKPESLIATAREQVREIDPEQPIYDVRTLAELRDQNLAPQRLNFSLLGIFAAIALALAVIGLYGVLAYAVTQRTRELGVRLALGAQRSDIVGLVIGQGVRLALIGVMLGLAGAFAMTNVVRGLLFEVHPFDPVIFTAIPLLLLTVTLLACWLPARRAAKVDPMEALRYE